MHPPVKWTENWAYQNPGKACIVLLFGIGLAGLTLWIILSDAAR